MPGFDVNAATPDTSGLPELVVPPQATALPPATTSELPWRDGR